MQNRSNMFLQQEVRPTPSRGQRKFHRFMNEMTVVQKNVFNGNQLPEMGPTQQVVELVDKKGRVAYVPVEWLQKGVVEPPNLATVVLTSGLVAQRNDNHTRSAGTRHWFVPGSEYVYSWEAVFQNAKKEQFTS